MKKFLKSGALFTAMSLFLSLSVFAAAPPIDDFKNMGSVPSGTELYIAVLQLAYSGAPLDKRPAVLMGDYSCRVLSLDVAGNAATAEMMFRPQGSFICYKILMDVRLKDQDLIVTAARESFSYSGVGSSFSINNPNKWTKHGTFSYISLNKKTVPVINLCQDFLGEKLMAVLTSDDYDATAKSVKADSRTWRYIGENCSSEQELAEFFAKNNLLDNPLTWRHVYMKCKNDLQFERFLTNYKILATKKSIPCVFKKAEMTNAEQKAQYGNRKYVGLFYYENGAIYVYSNAGEFIDFNEGDALILNTTVSSCEYRSITGGGVASVDGGENNDRWQAFAGERGKTAIDLIVIE